jgi:hypothetical protein
MPSNKTWGEIFEMGGILVTMPFAAISGIIQFMDDGEFEKGFNLVSQPAADAGREFGEKHGQTVEKKLVRMAVQATVMTVTGVLVDGVIDPTTPGADPPKDTPS